MKIKIYTLSAFCFALTVTKAQTTVNLQNSNLPIVVITVPNNDTIPWPSTGFGVPATDPAKITAQMKIIYNGVNVRNKITDTKYNYNGTIGIEVRGNSSASFNQKQYGLETRDASGNDLDVSLMNMPPESDWILSAPYNDVSMVRNVLAYKMWEDMGHYAPRTKMVELVLIQKNISKYAGVYMLTEKIKRDSNRVDVAKLNATDISGRELTGGYIMKIDAESGNAAEKTFVSKVKGFKMAANATTQTTADITWGYEYPKSADITPQQQAYIKNYIDTIETYLRDGNMAYREYISRQSFIDYFIHSEISKNADGLKKSLFFHKEKEQSDGTKGKLKAGTVWDYNLGFGNCSFCNANKTTGWVYKGCETLPVPAMWQNLLKDTEYANDLKCRYTELRQTILKKETINTSINLTMDTLVEASARQFIRYKELLSTLPLPAPGSFGSNNPSDPIGWFVGYRVASYSAERDSLKNFYDTRLIWLDANMPGTCVVNGIGTESKTTSFAVYPNPSTSIITLKMNTKAEKIEIYTMAGYKIDEFIPTSLEDFEINTLQNQGPGIYFVRVTVDGIIHTTKVLRE